MSDVRYKKDGGWVNAALAIYKVGSIYMSVDGTSPATLFGGTWERITGKFLLGATDGGTSGATQKAGNTGGEASHKLTVDEMPSHTHIQNSHSHTQDGHSHTVNGGGVTSGGMSGNQWHSHIPGVEGYRFNLHKRADLGGQASRQRFSRQSLDNWTWGAVSQDDLMGADTTNAVNLDHTHWVPDHTHAVSTSTPAIHGTAATNQNTGGSGSHNNMPPFLSVYIWKRIA